MFSRLVRPLSITILLGASLGFAPAVLGQTKDAIEARVAGLEKQLSVASRQFDGMQVAQLFNRPPADVPEQDSPDGDQPQSAAGLDLRVDRLENQVRSLTGQIEQTQFAIHRLEEDLHKFQQDVDFRLQDQSGRPLPHPLPQKRADLGDQPPTRQDYPGAAPLAGPTPLPGTLPDAPAAPPARRGDAFDPDAQPGAPGAPRPLGSPPRAAGVPPPVAYPAGPIATDPGDDDDPTAPLDLSRASANPVPPRPAVPPLNAPPGSLASTGVPGPAPLPPAPGMTPGPREDFDAALAVFKQGQYETAQTDFQSFIQRYPRDRLVPDAVYYLGETYSQRGRHREAAEQYLKVATDYAKSPRAPDGLVRLGVSLNALGAKEQACATFGEVARKYPNASAAVKASVDREQKKAKC